MLIGSNHLTNLQLYWVADALVRYKKFQKTVLSDAAKRLELFHMHVIYKSNVGFQEAFQCNMTDNELDEYQEFERKKEEFKNYGEFLRNAATLKELEETLLNASKLLNFNTDLFEKVLHGAQ